MKKLIFIFSIILSIGIDAQPDFSSYSCDNDTKVTKAPYGRAFNFETADKSTRYFDCNLIGSHNLQSDETILNYVANFFCTSKSFNQMLPDNKTYLSFVNGNFLVSQKNVSGREKRTKIKTKTYFRIGENKEIDENTEPYECLSDGR